MSITDIIFVFCFLPVSLVIYHLCRGVAKEIVLLLVSLVFYACGSPKYFLLFILSLVVNILLGRIIHTSKDRLSIRTILLIIGIVLDVSILGYYKYADFALSTVGSLTGKDVILHNFILPLGISFFTFKEISYLVDIYKGKAALSKSPLQDALYLSFFAQIQSGPISRFSDLSNNILAGKEPFKIKFSYFSEGVFRFMIGFNKKILISNVLSNMTTEIFHSAASDMSAPYAWLGAIGYSLQLFFDFSGYSDMAIGITQMFGYSCPENFNYPYMTESVSKFWRRWHITLGSWFRDYIYFPMGGSRVKSKSRLYLNLFVVWILTGIWHGANWNFIFWGLAYFVLIAFEKTTGWPECFHTKAGKVLYRIFTLFFINFQWVIFNSANLKSGLAFIRCMLCPSGNALANARTLFLIKDNFVFLLLAIILCFPIVPWLEKKFDKKTGTRQLWQLLMTLITVSLFIWALSFVVAGQNNPFAYANF